MSNDTGSRSIRPGDLTPDREVPREPPPRDADAGVVVAAVEGRDSGIGREMPNGRTKGGRTAEPETDHTAEEHGGNNDHRDHAGHPRPDLGGLGARPRELPGQEPVPHSVAHQAVEAHENVRRRGDPHPDRRMACGNDLFDGFGDAVGVAAEFGQRPLGVGLLGGGSDGGVELRVRSVIGRKSGLGGARHGTLCGDVARAANDRAQKILVAVLKRAVKAGEVDLTASGLTVAQLAGVLTDCTHGAKGEDPSGATPADFTRRLGNSVRVIIAGIGAGAPG